MDAKKDRRRSVIRDVGFCGFAFFTCFSAFVGENDHLVRGRLSNLAFLFAIVPFLFDQLYEKRFRFVSQWRFRAGGLLIGVVAVAMWISWGHPSILFVAGIVGASMAVGTLLGFLLARWTLVRFDETNDAIWVRGSSRTVGIWIVLVAGVLLALEAFDELGHPNTFRASIAPFLGVLVGPALFKPAFLQARIAALKNQRDMATTPFQPFSL